LYLSSDFCIGQCTTQLGYTYREIVQAEEPNILDIYISELRRTDEELASEQLNNEKLSPKDRGQLKVCKKIYFTIIFRIRDQIYEKGMAG
jgi:hypothetical protein